MGNDGKFLSGPYEVVIDFEGDLQGIGGFNAKGKPQLLFRTRSIIDYSEAPAKYLATARLFASSPKLLELVKEYGLRFKDEIDTAELVRLVEYIESGETK